MKQITNYGNLPNKIRPFLGQKLPGGQYEPKVYECTISEVEHQATKEQLELHILVDRRETGRAYLMAMGIVDRDTVELALFGQRASEPVVYFAELEDAQRRRVVREVTKARRERAEKDLTAKKIRELQQSGNVAIQG